MFVQYTKKINFWIILCVQNKLGTIIRYQSVVYDIYILY